MQRGLKLALLVVLLVAAPWALAYGPLFAWSPVKPGYDHLAFVRADVYFPTGTVLPEPYRRVDQMIDEAEAFHRMKMHSRLKVVACRNWDDFGRFVPIIRSRGVGAVTLLHNAIYVTPRIAERGFDHGEFLRHEISHAIVHQNMSVWKAFTIQDYSWVYEGMPVRFGNQRAFVTQAEFAKRGPATDLTAFFVPPAAAASKDMRFAYVAWRNFIDYLVAKRGPDTFDRFFKAFIADPAAHDRLFREFYGSSLTEEVARFRLDLASGAFRPENGQRSEERQ